ncbi:MAG: glycosyltransferase [Nitrospinae bacterium]|nr:glycosyltransferase [Nitrospinota bacterium]
MIILFGTNYRVGQTGHFAHIALQRMGHTVIPFTAVKDAPEDWIVTGPDVDAVALFEQIGGKADAFFMVESSTGSPFLPRRIEELCIPTACWYYDNYLNFRWNKEVVALFDYGFFAQMGRVKQARSYGMGHVDWLPFAADEVFHRNFHMERDIDIGYLGTITEQKNKYFSQFEKCGLKVVTNERFYSFDEIGKFYSRCKVVYNILARRDLNVRAFEAPSAGAVCVNQGYIDEGAHLIFKEGETTMYHRFADAPEICRRLLSNPIELERMSQKAEELVLTGHTYRHRMEKVLESLARGVSNGRMGRRASFAAPVAESLTCGHRDFKWRDRAYEKLAEAFRRGPLGNVVSYLFRYAFWRIREKLEKLWWSLGKAPV